MKCLASRANGSGVGSPSSPSFFRPMDGAWIPAVWTVTVACPLSTESVSNATRKHPPFKTASTTPGTGVPRFESKKDFALKSRGVERNPLAISDGSFVHTPSSLASANCSALTSSAIESSSVSFELPFLTLAQPSAA